MAHFIIVANGEFLVHEIINEAIRDKTIIALDGAADKLARIGVQPHIILGDFDSISVSGKNNWGIKKSFSELKNDDAPYTGNFGVFIVPAKNQNLSDLTKAIRYCDKNNAESITIICATGGQLHHHETNLRSLRTEYKKSRPIILHTEQQTLRHACDEEVELHGKVGDKCGIMAYPQGSFTSHGLEYEVTDYELKFGFAESSSNALKQLHAKISVKGEALLIMPPLLKAQRVFAEKSEIEQLELRLWDARAKSNMH